MTDSPASNLKILTLFIHPRLARKRQFGSATLKTNPWPFSQGGGGLCGIANERIATMIFTTTWFAGEDAISSDQVGSLAAARDIARSRLVAHKVRSGATHVEVRADGGALLYSSTASMAPACARGPSLAAQLVRRLSMPNSTPA